MLNFYETFCLLNLSEDSFLMLYYSENNQLTLEDGINVENISYSKNDSVDDIFYRLCFNVKKLFPAIELMNNRWINILLEQGLLKEKIENKITYY